MKVVNLEWILPVAPEVKVKVPKEKKMRDKKKRRPVVQRTNQRAMNMRRK